MRHVLVGFFAPKAVLPLALFVAVAWLVLAGCGGSIAGNNEDEDDSVTTRTPNTTVTPTTEDTSPAASDVFFAKKKPVGGLSASARSGGVLTLDEKGCFRIKSVEGRRGHVPIWPPTFKVRVEGEEITILDGQGDLVAQVGERLLVGGGEFPGIGRESTLPLESIPSVSKRVGRKLEERCPGQYWLVAPPAPRHKSVAE
ncbi:hypothetical protein BH23ACT11_BH23ACT11_25560 [soil metagenome]